MNGNNEDYCGGMRSYFDWFLLAVDNYQNKKNCRFLERETIPDLIISKDYKKFIEIMAIERI